MRIWAGVSAGIAVVACATAALIAVAPMTDVVAGTATRALGNTQTGPSSFPATPEPAPSTPTSSAPLNENGVPFASAKGHFKATFPATPAVTSPSGSGSDQRVKITIAVAKNPLAEIESEILTVALSASQQQQTLRAAIKVFASTAGLTVESQQGTTFRGKSAIQATFSSMSGVFIAAEIFFTSGTTMYTLVAEKGAVFDILLASFVAT